MSTSSTTENLIERHKRIMFNINYESYKTFAVLEK